MKRFCYALAVSAMLVVCAGTADAQVSIGIQIGPPPVPRAYRIPPQPGPDYEWVEGYWYPQGNRYVWHNGYWTRPPYPDAYWVAPYYEGGRYFPGRWEGRSGIVEHNHQWDRSRQRDERRGSRDRDERHDQRHRDDDRGRGDPDRRR